MTFYLLKYDRWERKQNLKKAKWITVTSLHSEIASSKFAPTKKLDHPTREVTSLPREVTPLPVENYKNMWNMSVQMNYDRFAYA